MGIFKKLSDLARAQINSFIDHIEDPQKLAHQAVLDLEASKKKAKQLLITVQASIKRIQQRKNMAHSKQQELIKQAQHLLQNADDDGAKKILKQKQELERDEHWYDEELKREQQTIAIINKGLVAIDEKIQELKSTTPISTGKAIIEKEDAFDTFSRMEEKIENTEMQLEALNELLQEEKNDAALKKTTTSFDKYSDPNTLEEELAAMKKKLKS